MFILYPSYERARLPTNNHFGALRKSITRILAATKLRGQISAREASDRSRVALACSPADGREKIRAARGVGQDMHWGKDLRNGVESRHIMG